MGRDRLCLPSAVSVSSADVEVRVLATRLLSSFRVRPSRFTSCRPSTRPFRGNGRVDSKRGGCGWPGRLVWARSDSAVSGPPSCRVWLSGVGRFAGSSRCCGTPTMRSAPVASGSSAGTRARCRAVPSTRDVAVVAGPQLRLRPRLHRPAEPPSSRAHRQTPIQPAPRRRH